MWLIICNKPIDNLCTTCDRVAQSNVVCVFCFKRSDVLTVSTAYALFTSCLLAQLGQCSLEGVLESLDDQLALFFGNDQRRQQTDHVAISAAALK